MVIVAKYCRKMLYGKRAKEIVDILGGLCRQTGVELLETHLMPGHIYMCLRIAWEFSVAFVVGFLKGKSAVLIQQNVLRHKGVTGMHFWGKGYCVSIVGLDEETISRCIREQEDRENDQPNLDLE